MLNKIACLLFYVLYDVFFILFLETKKSNKKLNFNESLEKSFRETFLHLWFTKFGLLSIKRVFITANLIVVRKSVLRKSYLLHLNINDKVNTARCVTDKKLYSEEREKWKTFKETHLPGERQRERKTEKEQYREKLHSIN